MRFEQLPNEIQRALQAMAAGTRIYVPQPDDNEERRQRAMELRQQGLTGREVAEQIGVTERTIWRWCSQSGTDSGVSIGDAR